MIKSTETTDHTLPLTKKEMVNEPNINNKGALHFAKFEMVEDLKIKFPELNLLSSDEAEEYLVYGMNIEIYTEKGKIKEGIIFTIDEESLVFLKPKTKKNKNDEIKIVLLKITDITRGKSKGNFFGAGNMDQNLSNIKDSLCLTIHYDNNFKFYNFIFKSENNLLLFVLGILRFLEKTMQENKTCNTDLLTLKKIWKEYDPNHNKYLDVDQFSKFLGNINFQWKKKSYTQIFKEIDLKKEGKIRFKDFISFYELIVTGEEFREVFQKYSSDPNKKYISMRGLTDFMEKEQHIKLTSQQAINLMTQFSKKTKKLADWMKAKTSSNLEMPNVIDFNDNRESMLNIYDNHSFSKIYGDQDEGIQNFKHAFNLNFREFVNMLIDKNFNTIFNSEYFSIHQNMNLPLYDYFIYSSHNTYLDGNQINSKSTLEMYYCALKNGCRLIELDCWDGRTGATDEPIITHWHFPVGELNFKEVLENINEFAFKKSEYPVILSVENHCSPKTQMNMEKYFTEVLGKDNLYIVDPENPPLNYPSPNELKRKYIVKCKRKRIFGNLDNMMKKSTSDVGREILKEKEKEISNNLHYEADYIATNHNPSTNSPNPLINQSLTPHSINNFNYEENITNNKKSNLMNMLLPEDVIEEECNLSNADNLSDLEEDIVTNNIISSNRDYNFKEFIDGKHTILNKQLNEVQDPNKNSNGLLTQVNNSKINPINLSNAIYSNNSIDKINLNINLNTYNITNYYSLPEIKGNLHNLTNTGKLNIGKPIISDFSNLRNENDFEESVKSTTENDKKFKFKNLELDYDDKNNKNELDDNYLINPANSNKKTNKTSHKKSFTSHDSYENLDKNEINALSVSNSNIKLKKLKIKYSVEQGNANNNEEENANNMENTCLSKAEIIRIKEIKKMDDVKVNKVPIKTIDQLATVVGMVGVKYKREDFESSKYLPWECISISEPDFEKYIKDVDLKLKILKFCQRSFLKIYPDILRTNSSNHDPVQCWAAGVQIAALNLQKTDDDSVLINKIFFKINGGSKSGYILKPEILRNPNLDETIKKLFWKPVFKIKLKVLSGFHLHLCFPKGVKITGISVEVSLRCPNSPFDDKKQTQETVLTTDTISNNFLHPVWQSNSKQFEVYDTDLSFFLIKIFSSKKQHLLARSVIPVKILNLGYRVLDLYDNVCSKFDSSFLILKTNKIIMN